MTTPDSFVAGQSATSRVCPACAEPIEGDSNFCEACGASLGAPSAPAAGTTAAVVAALAPAPGSTDAGPLDLGAGPISAVTRIAARLGGTPEGASGGTPGDTASSTRPCLQCGGLVGADGYCETCGAKALSERDHFREQPATWVAGVSDKGISHHRNEDAMALSATADPTAAERRAVLIVLDGVSNTHDSSIGSLAGARACLPLLAAPLPRGMGTPAGRLAAVTASFTTAVAEANREVVAATTPGTDKPASATFTAVVLEGGTAFHANIGDSRSYWLPDEGEGVLLTVDDSAAQAQIAAGIPRAQAESSPQAHAITKWLGDDSPSLIPTVGQLDVTGPGWLLACSDGLWNYASEPAQLKAQITAAGTLDPAALALALVGFANACGGRDNITATLARVEAPAMHNDPTPPSQESPVAEFTAAVYQNEFLPDGGTDVNAIVTIGCAGAGSAGQTGSGDAGEIIIVDISGSMGTETMDAAKVAAQAALAEILDGTWFSVIAGSDRAYLAYPTVTSGPGMVRMSGSTREEASAAIAAFRASGGTAIGTWLDLAVTLFGSVPQVSQKHAILLTDGENREAPGALEASLERATGVFQCDCRGAGTDWQVEEIRQISQALLGTVDIIPEPAQMQHEFQTMMRTSMARGVADAQLRVWAPQGAQVLFVRQVSPTVEDLTDRRVQLNPLTGGYPTGAWADESRDYHVAVRLPAKAVGQEQLAARVQISVAGADGQSAVAAQALVKATWSNDSELTAKIDQQVAHYTGQTELASMIQEGLAAKAAGDEATATTKLGRAVQLAAETGNDEATSRLKKVVDVQDEREGTVRLKAAVAKADEMALDTASTKTTRVKK